MDRKQEYDTLMQELRQTPPALEGTLDRALDRRRARRRKLRPLRSLAAAAAVFVLLVNVSIPFAQACTHIPVLGWLAQAVCFSHSLSSAVEHDRRCAFPTACPPQWSTTWCKRWSRPSATTAIPSHWRT